MQPIDHCTMTSEIEKAGMSKEDIQEAVLERVGKLVEAKLAGIEIVPSDHKGIDLIAIVVADRVISEGAVIVAQDLKVDLEELKAHASKKHISFC